MKTKYHAHSLRHSLTFRAYVNKGFMTSRPQIFFPEHLPSKDLDNFDGRLRHIVHHAQTLV